jgi:hypothetical protein
MERHGVMGAAGADAENTVVGIVHLHDLMKAGAV